MFIKDSSYFNSQPTAAIGIMNSAQMPIAVDYTIDDLQSIGQDQYFTEGTSGNSTVSSPIMYMPPVEHTSYEPFQENQMPYQRFDVSHPTPIVEFTDLTAPYRGDRRRRRSHPYDKQTISSMHMRRRAQNRASQRAFRERKEKHAQDLQKQLEELNEKHTELQASHDRLEQQNEELRKEVKVLRGETPPSPEPSVTPCEELGSLTSLEESGAVLEFDNGLARG